MTYNITQILSFLFLSNMLIHLSIGTFLLSHCFLLTLWFLWLRHLCLYLSALPFPKLHVKSNSPPETYQLFTTKPLLNSGNISLVCSRHGLLCREHIKTYLLICFQMPSTNVFRNEASVTRNFAKPDKVKKKNHLGDEGMEKLMNSQSNLLCHCCKKLTKWKQKIIVKVSIISEYKLWCKSA